MRAVGCLDALIDWSANGLEARTTCSKWWTGQAERESSAWDLLTHALRAHKHGRSVRRESIGQRVGQYVSHLRVDVYPSGISAHGPLIQSDA